VSFGHETETAPVFDRTNEPTQTVVGHQLPPDQWRITSRQYDDFGNVTLTTDPAGRQQQTLFDLDNELVVHTAGFGSNHPETDTKTYDAQGNVTLVVDAAGNQELKRYDNRNRLSEDIKGYGTPVAETTLTFHDLDGEVTETVVGFATRAEGTWQTGYDDFGVFD
jgi:YD repeat-containing protein